jgi:cell wall assembly regulator SMI1
MIAELIAQLDSRLSEVRPDYYKKLNQGISDETLNLLEEKYNRKIPVEMKYLYKWKNGQQGYRSFVNNSCFLPLETVLKNAEELNKMIGKDFQQKNWWNENWLLIFENGNGSGMGIDLEGVFTNQPYQIIEFWAKNSIRRVLYPNLETLLQKIIEMYENEAEELTDPFALEDYTQFPSGFPLKFDVK